MATCVKILDATKQTKSTKDLTAGNNAWTENWQVWTGGMQSRNIDLFWADNLIKYHINWEQYIWWVHFKNQGRGGNWCSVIMPSTVLEMDKENKKMACFVWNANRSWGSYQLMVLTCHTRSCLCHSVHPCAFASPSHACTWLTGPHPPSCEHGIKHS